VSQPSIGNLRVIAEREALELGEPAQVHQACVGDGQTTSVKPFELRQPFQHCQIPVGELLDMGVHKVDKDHRIAGTGGGLDCAATLHDGSNDGTFPLCRARVAFFDLHAVTALQVAASITLDRAPRDRPSNR
jgi:hypothetical protein